MIHMDNGLQEQKRRYVVDYDRTNCIGAEMCAFIDPENFRMNEDGKADMIHGKEKEPGQFVMLTDENMEDIGNPLRRAADSCPAAVIRITEIATGRRVAGAPQRR